jgi:hypothetical protein
MPMSDAESSIDIDRYLSRTKALDLSGIDWSDIRQAEVSSDVWTVLDYMRAVEAHTIVFPRTIFSARAVNDPVVGPFLVSWLYEETFHARALERFMAAAGRPLGATGPPLSFRDRLEGLGTSLLSLWPQFLALHMTWGAVHELTTLLSYQRLSKLAGHGVLSTILDRIMRDEAKHFDFYFQQARERLQRPATAKVTRFFVDRLWKPVGNGVRPLAEMRTVSGILFRGPDGREAARRVDNTIRQLPGFADVRLFEAWLLENVPDSARGWDEATARPLA